MSGDSSKCRETLESIQNKLGNFDNLKKTYQKYVQTIKKTEESVILPVSAPDVRF